jgi:prevent-host-death family protein
MTTVTLEEARTRLPDLIKAAQSGEEIVISDADRPAVKLVPVQEAERRPRFGSAKGKIIMADDFDEPLADFDEYMP